MLEFQIIRDAGRSQLTLHGTLESFDDADALREAFAFITTDDHLVVDLSEVTDLGDPVTDTLHDLLLRRSSIAESVVISPSAAITAHLYSHSIHQVSPIVVESESARSILDSRGASRRHHLRT